MKLLLLSFCASLFVLFLVSCEITPTCMVCQYTYDGISYSSGEVHGKREEIRELEETWQAYEELYGVEVECRPCY